MNIKRSLTLKVKYLGRNTSPGAIGPILDDPDSPLLVLKHYRDDVPDKGRLESAMIVDEKGQVIRVIV